MRCLDFSFFFQIIFWVKYSQLPISKIQNQIIQFRIEKKKDVSLKKGVIKEFFLNNWKINSYSFFINFTKREENKSTCIFSVDKSRLKVVNSVLLCLLPKQARHEWMEKILQLPLNSRQWNHCLFIPTRSYKKNPLCHRYLFICWRTTAESINHFAKSRKLSDKISYMCQQRRIQASRI